MSFNLLYYLPILYFTISFLDGYITNCEEKNIIAYKEAENIYCTFLFHRFHQAKLMIFLSCFLVTDSKLIKTV